MRLNSHSDVEEFLKQNAYSDSHPHFSAVWQKMMLADRREVNMAEKKGGFKVLAWLMSFMVIAALGWFGLTKFAAIQKMDKIDKGENIVVTLVVGDVNVKKLGSSDWRPLMVEDVVAMGDSLKTGKDSYCEIQMVGRGVFRLENETELELAMLVNVDGNVQSSMKLAKGEIGLKPKSLKEGEIFEVETDTAVAAVRGTKFSVKADGSGNTMIAVAEGKVDVVPNIKAFQKAEEQGLVDKKAAEILKQQMIQPVSVTANEELAMDSKQIEVIDQAIEKGIVEIAKVEGPITAEKMGYTEPVTEEVKAEDKGSTDTAADKKSEEKTPVVVAPKLEIVNKIMKSAEKEVQVKAKETGIKEIAFSDPQAFSKSLSVKQEISEESRKKLEQISEEKIISSADEIVKLNIKSNPLGANVYINGELAGVTPLEKVYSKGKELDIRIEKDGFTAFSEKISLNNPDVTVAPQLNSLQDKVAKTEEKKEEVKADEPKKEEVKAEETAPQPVSGDLEWKKNLSFVTDVENPVVYRGKIYATKGNMLYILNLNGQVEKKVSVVSADSALVRPVAGNGLVFLGSKTGGLYAYNLDGSLAWKDDSVGKQMFGASPAVGNGLVVAPSISKGIKIFSASGALLDSINVASPVYSTPYIGKDGKVVIYGTESKQLVAYDLENKKELWKKTLEDRVLYPLYGNDNVVIVIMRNSGQVVGYDPVTGEEKWNKTISGLEKTKVNPAAFGDMLVMVSAEKDRAIVLYMDNGGMVASKKVDNISTIPFLSGSWLYIGTADGKVVGYNYSSKKEFTQSTGEAISIVAADKTGVYAVSQGKMSKLVK